MMHTARNFMLTVVLAAMAGPCLADEPFTFTLVSPEADMTAREITEQLYKAKAGERIDLSGRDLTYLDLATIDFKGASLARTDLYGTDFTGANLKGADLSSARLDRAVLIRADLSGANLEGATILRPTIYSDLSGQLADAPRFSGANLRGIKVQAELSGADFRGADLTEADFHPLEDRAGEGTLTTLRKNVAKSCDFSGANLQRANFSEAVLTFSRMTGADLRDANLSHADLSKVDFQGADLTGADVTGADLDGANLAGARGLDFVKGLDAAHNLDKAFR
jgi:uncharacterized protein YjbI with pentapeptide repeats